MTYKQMANPVGLLSVLAIEVTFHQKESQPKAITSVKLYYLCTFFSIEFEAAHFNSYAKACNFPSYLFEPGPLSYPYAPSAISSRGMRIILALDFSHPKPLLCQSTSLSLSLE